MANAQHLPAPFQGSLSAKQASKRGRAGLTWGLTAKVDQHRTWRAQHSQNTGTSQSEDLSKPADLWCKPRDMEPGNTEPWNRPPRWELLEFHNLQHFHLLRLSRLVFFALAAKMAGAPLSPSELAEVRVMLQEWRQHRAMDTLSISSSGPSEEATGSIEPPSGSIFSSPTQPAESSDSDGSSIAVNMANAPLGIRTAAA